MGQAKLASNCSKNALQLAHLKQMLVMIWGFIVLITLSLVTDTWVKTVLEYRQEILHMLFWHSTEQSENCAY